MVKKVPICMCFLAVALAVWAGDVAQLAILGFSPDGRYFMFGQYGILEKTAAPYADLFLVDVRANAFVPQGVKRVSYTQPAEPGSDGLGALLNVVCDQAAQKRQYRIDYLATGRILYLLVDGSTPVEPLEFRDFVSGRKYTVSLVQSTGTKDGEPAASFYLKVSVQGSDGSVSEKNVGDPSLQRPGVLSYRVKQVILGPDGSLVFVIQREEAAGPAPNIRYMVETTRIQ